MLLQRQIHTIRSIFSLYRRAKICKVRSVEIMLKEFEIIKYDKKELNNNSS